MATREMHTVKHLVGRHVRVRPVGDGRKCLLNILWRCPTEKVVWGTGFVIGSRDTATAKWLLANNGTSTLVVDIQISSRILECIDGFLQKLPTI